MIVMVKPCSRIEMVHACRRLRDANNRQSGWLRDLRIENASLSVASRELADDVVRLRDANSYLMEVIHDLGCALDHVNDILNVYHISTLGTPDDEK